MTSVSAGVLLYRLIEENSGAHVVPEVLIAHMGGPFWAKKDAAAWTIPKGEYDPDSEAPLDAALREFGEELGKPAPGSHFTELGTFTYSSGKRVTVFVANGSDFSLDGLVFGEFELEWPPRSGRVTSFPEVDRVAWTTLDAARERLVKGQRPVLDALVEYLDSGKE